ncbi:uncharacterized protein LOC117181116 [Belonocnema kinseyi]|uniref:uncharacterized protein LOC117181116 n=1 Tax=Belonocnema kinseyi TaxID=2817044 RepID=UPI00143D365B|nr:uncharacterized protein LOC117181116 [Belonocnema kinseyi]
MALAHMTIVYFSSIRIGNPNPGIPTKDNKANKNFATRALYSNIDHNKYCIVYETECHEILGAKLPPWESSEKYKHDPPYEGIDYVVRNNPPTLLLMSVHLFS